VVAQGNYIGEHAILARSKPKPAKREETTAEFVQRVSRKGGKTNGLKLRFVWIKRRHHRGVNLYPLLYLFLLPVIYLAAPGRPATPGLNRISELPLLNNLPKNIWRDGGRG